MAQAKYCVSDLPESALLASAAFYAEHLEKARAQVADSNSERDLVIVLPAAGPEHTDWRQALAKTLARECAPARVNVVGASDEANTRSLCNYLAGAKGVTGHYCQTHE